MSRKRKKESREEKPEAQEDQIRGANSLEGKNRSAEQESAGPGADDSKPVAEEAELVEEEPARDEEETGAGPEEKDWEQEMEVLLDRLKRKQAEMDNLRRISKLEQAEARNYALYDFLSRLLPVLDNLERALESARSDESVPQSHVEGLEMIYKQLHQILDQEGVSIIEAEGAPFDPNCHHAVMEVESEEAEPGSVVEELQKGYWHRQRVLRPAMVKVCRE